MAGRNFLALEVYNGVPPLYYFFCFFLSDRMVVGIALVGRGSSGEIKTQELCFHSNTVLLVFRNGIGIVNKSFIVSLL